MEKQGIPFEFILDDLYPIDITVKSMFGMKAIYHGEIILLMLRLAEKNPAANGIWVAIAPGQGDSLVSEIPALKTVQAYEKKKSNSEWLLLSADHEAFEKSATGICQLIKRRDPRIGRIPKKTAKKKKPAGK